MKRTMRKGLGVVLAFVCAMGLAGCNDKSAKETTQKADVFNFEKGVYLFEEKTMDIPADASVTEYYVKDNNLYFTYIKEPEKAFCRYKIDSGEMTKLYAVKYEYDEKQVINDTTFYMDENENKMTLAVKHEYADENSKGKMAVTYTVNDKTGKEISAEDVTSQLIKEDDNPNKIYIELSNAVAADGTMYVMVHKGHKTEVARFRDGKVKGSISIDGFISEIALDNEDNPIVVINEMKSGIAPLDFESGATGDMLYEPEGDFVSGEVMSGKANIPFFIKTSTGLSVFDKKSKEKKDILDWLDSDLLSDNVMSIIPYDNEKIFCIHTGDDGIYKVGFLVRHEEAQAEKKVIEVASLYANSELQKKIIAYNNINKDFKIEYKSYEEREEPEKAFANDIIAGKIPDILDVTNLDVSNYIAKGVLEDLSPYLEKDDEINKDYFVDGVLDVTSVDGKNYFLTKYYALHGFIGKKTEFGKYADGWTLHDIMDCYNSMKGEKRLLPVEYNVNVAGEFLYSDMTSYVDWKTGKVDFDNEYFKSGLEFCKGFPEVDEEGQGGEIYPLIREGKLMLNSIYMTDFDQMQMQESLFDGEVVFMGFPSKDKKGINFACVSDTYAISSTSECKEEAWDLIKYILLSKDEFMQGFPTSDKEFEKYVKRVTTTVEYTEEDGTVVKPRGEVRSANSFEIRIEPLKEETIETFRKLLKNSTLESEEYNIKFLIEDDINSYFEGTKTLDTTIKIIEDKVSKYINENR